MDRQKLDFISTWLIPILKTLTPDTAGKWGRMNAQQMIEHVSGFFQVSTNKKHFPFVTPVEHLPKYIEFLRSDKEFRQNTKAPVLPEQPLPVRFASLDAAIDDLEKEVNAFTSFFEIEPAATSQHPVFGDLNFDDWVLLHYKHVSHHLKQFGLAPPPPDKI